MILNNLSHRLNQTAIVYQKSITRDDDGNTITSYDQAKGKIKGFKYQLGATNRIINEKYRSQIDSFFITQPSYDFDILENDKIEIDCKEYAVLYLDDVGEQGQVIQIAMRLWNVQTH